MAPQHYPIVSAKNRDEFMALVASLRELCLALFAKHDLLPRENQIEEPVFASFMISAGQAIDPERENNTNFIANLVELASEAFDLVFSFFDQFEKQHKNELDGDVSKISDDILIDLTCIRMVFSKLNGLIQTAVTPQKIKERK